MLKNIINNEEKKIINYENDDQENPQEKEIQLLIIENEIEQKHSNLRDYIMSHQFKEVSKTEEKFSLIREEYEKKLTSNSLLRNIQASKNNQIDSISYHDQDYMQNPHNNIIRKYANYMPLRENIYVGDSLHFFYPNIGEHIFEKIQTNWNLIHEDAFLGNDFQQDEILYEFLNKYGENDNNIETYLKYKEKICPNQIVKQRFEKFLSQFQKNPVKFREKGCSVRAEEPIDYHTIQKTHKELFCRRCLKYDCQIHGIMECSSFTSSKKFTKIQMEDSYDQMLKKFLSIHPGKNITSTQQQQNPQDFLKSFTNISLNNQTMIKSKEIQELDQKLYSKDLVNLNHLLFNSDLQIDNQNNIINNDKPLNIKPCGSTCFLTPFENSILAYKFDTKRKKQTKDQVEFYHSKIILGVEKFKFEPCNIRLLFNANEITCTEIFDYLQKNHKKIMMSLNLEHEPHHNNNDQISQIGINGKKARKMTTISKKRNYLPNWKLVFSNTAANHGKSYVPCYHHYYDKNVSIEEMICKHPNCPCYTRGFCDKYCGCDESQCQIRRKGCQCQSNCLGQKCFCYSINAECDPDLCKGCFATIEGSKKKNSCQNNLIFFGKNKRCIVGKSDVCNELGLFNIIPIEKGEFVYAYLGEIISWEEGELREKWNESDSELYLFTLTDKFVIDAKFKGNKARFINHSKAPNIMARTVFSRGEYHCAFYALENIKPGMELFFDYDGNNTLWEKFSWIKNTKIKSKRVKVPHQHMIESRACQEIKYKELMHSLLPRKVRIVLKAPEKIKRVTYMLEMIKNVKSMKNIEIEGEKNDYANDDTKDDYDDEEYDSDFGYIEDELAFA